MMHARMAVAASWSMIVCNMHGHQVMMLVQQLYSQVVLHNEDVWKLVQGCHVE